MGNLYLERIDLGIGRALGDSPLSSIALPAPGQLDEHDHFPRQAAELWAFLRGSFADDHSYAALARPLDCASKPSL